MSEHRSPNESALIDPEERRWLERRALELAREFDCPLPAALVAARHEFEALRTRPKAVVISLVAHHRRRVRRPREASS